MTDKTNDRMSEQEASEYDAENADLVKQIKASAKEIWLAGLGAFNQKQGEKSTEGDQSLYQQLVKEGKDIERVSREHLDRNFQSVKSLAFESVDQVKEKAAGSFNRLESVFDERVSKALSRLGLTTSHDYAVLESRLDHAEHRISDLEGALEGLKRDIEKPKNTRAKKAQ